MNRKERTVSNRIDELLSAKEGKPTSFYQLSTRFRTDEDIQFFNYLISLQDKDIEWYLWNNIVIRGKHDCTALENDPLLSADAKKFVQKRIDAWNDIEENKYRCDKLETERLILRPAVPEDEDIFFNEFRTYPEDFEMWLSVKATEKNISKGVWNIMHCFSYFILENKNTHETMGYCALNVPKAKLGGVLEYYIFRKHRKRGYCKEACKAIIEEAFAGRLFIFQKTPYADVYRKKYYQIDTVKASCWTINAGSNAVLQALGFICSGINFESKIVDGKLYSENLYYLQKPHGI